ncbi:glycosyl hydrolase [Phragmitibacter flavus]|uniref:Glycosyl hydrolase n=1 Tax=Phragmitibacter flavus TaxID=2576071 RepID=A0A5R8KKY1_9BACT|nr:NPCBM/NEW2 domain-containing protein [Phragmitibacter flavus]TLD72309.1 glycosyl hydrolase [Phragmitibacter flavus]
MHPFIAALLLTLTIPGLSHALDPASDIATQVPKAAATLTAFHGPLPGDLERKLHIIYWTPSDREPQPQWRERLSRVLETTADFYDKELRRQGFPVRRLPLDHQPDGLLSIHLVKGTHPYAHYSGESGNEIRKECLPVLRQAGIIKSLDGRDETLVIFCNMSVWDPVKRTMRQNSPYYAGGNAKGGTAWQVDSALLDPDLLADKANHLQDGQYGRISLGKYNSIFVGGVVHEIGHALGLPHNRERSDEAAAFGTALMGSGNRTFGEEKRDESKGSFLTLAHGMRLASHPFFTGSNKALTDPIVANLSVTQISINGKIITVSGQITSAIPTYAIVGYTDPKGGGDYDATTQTTIPNADGSFEITFTDPPIAKPGVINLVACHVNGMTTSLRGLGYQPTPDGQIDVSNAQIQLHLESLAARFAVAGGVNPLDSISNSNDPILVKTHAIAQRIWSSSPPPETTPANIPEDIRTLSLCDTKPEKMEVGYGKPSTDKLPSPQPWLSSSGQIFERGYYAHAPARHQFQLGKAWKQLLITPGVATGQYGKVIFLIKGDGRELFKSKLTSADSPLQSIKVDLTNIDTLELMVEDGGDGKNGDWGLWLDPKLSR